MCITIRKDHQSKGDFIFWNKTTWKTHSYNCRWQIDVYLKKLWFLCSISCEKSYKQNIVCGGKFLQIMWSKNLGIAVKKHFWSFRMGLIKSGNSFIPSVSLSALSWSGFQWKWDKDMVWCNINSLQKKTCTHINSHLRDNSPNGMFLGDWREPDNPEEAHVDPRRTHRTPYTQYSEVRYHYKAFNINI